MRTLLLSAALACAASAALARSPAPASAAVLDGAALARAAFGNDAPWYQRNIPFLDAPDARLVRVYDYRWQLFRSHIRDIGTQGSVFTEFLPEVGWDRKPYNTINDSAAFPLLEGRWMRDPAPVDDFIDYLHADAGNNRQYTESVADAAWQRYRVTGDAAPLLRHLGAMRYVFNAWDDRYDPRQGLYWIEPLFDATEYTISSITASGGKDGFTGGMAFRPTVNTFMYANARAIAQVAALAGDAATAREFSARAQAIRTQVQARLWNDGLQHFTDRYQQDNAFVHYGDFISGRELAGYLPWYAELPDDTPRYAQAWRHLLSTSEFQGPSGLRTVGPSFPQYMKQYRYFPDSTRPECQWNGPVWPFQVSQVLTGLANLLNDYHQDVITRADYVRLLQDYTRLHFQGDRLDLQEDYDPETGQVIVGDVRSHHYFHSSYVDLVIGGLLGIRPGNADGSLLVVNPLLPDAPGQPGWWPWFALQDVPWHGHLLTLVFDADGGHYGRGAGLTLIVDGRVAAHRATLGRIEIALARRATAPAPPARDLATNIRRAGFPRPSSSTGADEATLFGAIDGRLWFFPELPKGWSTAGAATSDNWFELDLGAPTRVTRAELAFADDAEHVAAPARYALQLFVDGAWRDAPIPVLPPALGNGITALHWSAQAAQRVRLRVTDAPGRATRLIALRLY
jgi:hypothetical protein